MTDGDSNPACFFEAFPRFAETSETGPWLDRLNARYVALIHSNRDVLRDARVLDLGSHDGRFTFAALKGGAERVVGIELDHRLLRAARENMEAYGVPRGSYEFVLGDIAERIEEVEPFDVVFCFGLLYHLTDHMLLLSRIAAREPRHLLIDTHVSQREGAVIELRNAFGQSPPPRGSHVEGRPTRAALESMLSYYGWTFEYFDWPGSGLADSEHTGDYRRGERVSLRVTCNETLVPAQERERAVGLVLEADDDRRSQWIAITQIAPRFGMTPQALRFWVRRAERERVSTDE